MRIVARLSLLLGIETIENRPSNVVANIGVYNEELRDLYSLPNIVRAVKSRRMRLAWHVARMGEGRVVHIVLVGKPEGKRPLGRPRRRWG